MSLIILLIAFLSFISSFAQENQKTIHCNIEGQVALTTNGKAVFFNLGGPAIKFSAKKIAVAVNFMPSLRFEREKEALHLTPILGIGPQVYFLKDNRFFVSLPCYYFSNKNSWVATAGIGYVFSKPKNSTK